MFTKRWNAYLWLTNFLKSFPLCLSVRALKHILKRNYLPKTREYNLFLIFLPHPCLEECELGMIHRAWQRAEREHKKWFDPICILAFNHLPRAIPTPLPARPHLRIHCLVCLGVFLRCSPLCETSPSPFSRQTGSEPGARFHRWIESAHGSTFNLTRTWLIGHPLSQSRTRSLAKFFLPSPVAIKNLSERYCMHRDGKWLCLSCFAPVQ